MLNDSIALGRPQIFAVAKETKVVRVNNGTESSRMTHFFMSLGLLTGSYVCYLSNYIGPLKHDKGVGAFRGIYRESVEGVLRN